QNHEPDIGAAVDEHPVELAEGVVDLRLQEDVAVEREENLPAFEMHALELGEHGRPAELVLRLPAVHTVKCDARQPGRNASVCLHRAFGYEQRDVRIPEMTACPWGNVEIQ